MGGDFVGVGGGCIDCGGGTGDKGGIVSAARSARGG